jgi:hypothetical protein
VCDTAKCAEALEDLGGVFGLVEVDGEKAVVGGEVEGRVFAGAEKVRDVFHLDEGHGRFLEFYSWWREAEVYESMRVVSIVLKQRLSLRNYLQRIVPSLRISRRSP